jgi:hypothetical protein
MVEVVVEKALRVCAAREAERRQRAEDRLTQANTKLALQLLVSDAYCRHVLECMQLQTQRVTPSLFNASGREGVMSTTHTPGVDHTNLTSSSEPLSRTEFRAVADVLFETVARLQVEHTESPATAVCSVVDGSPNLARSPGGSSSVCGSVCADDSFSPLELERSCQLDHELGYSSSESSDTSLDKTGSTHHSISSQPPPPFETYGGNQGNAHGREARGGRGDGGGGGVVTGAPYWQPNDTVDSCTNLKCGKRFGLFRHKHHCRRCGKVVCSMCSLNRVVLPALGYFEPVRVCDTCLVLVP